MVVPTDIQVSSITGALLADLGAPVIAAAARESREQLATLNGSYQLRALAYPAVFVGPAATRGAPFHACLYGGFLALMSAGGWLGDWLGFRWVLAGSRPAPRALPRSAGSDCRAGPGELAGADPARQPGRIRLRSIGNAVHLAAHDLLRELLGLSSPIPHYHWRSGVRASGKVAGASARPDRLSHAFKRGNHHGDNNGIEYTGGASRTSVARRT